MANFNVSFHFDHFNYRACVLKSEGNSLSPLLVRANSLVRPICIPTSSPSRVIALAVLLQDSIVRHFAVGKLNFRLLFLGNICRGGVLGTSPLEKLLVCLADKGGNRNKAIGLRESNPQLCRLASRKRCVEEDPVVVCLTGEQKSISKSPIADSYQRENKPFRVEHGSVDNMWPIFTPSLQVTNILYNPFRNRNIVFGLRLLGDVVNNHSNSLADIRLGNVNRSQKI